MFEERARSHGWVASPRAPQPPRDWISVYRQEGAELRLAHYPASSRLTDSQGISREVPEQVTCALEFRTDASTWETKIPEMIINGSPLDHANPLDTTHYQGGPPGMTVKSWRLASGAQVHATYIPQRGTLELSINYFPEP
ncbi:hypothetical protein [Brevundimonas sp.]|uniref:hypothetical protein n=1 Tax=Brevundimonas sp. TaxID=1871086 RepID=UPI00260CC2B7|nr:hypothetical protein [Brevundimonas sp.]